MRPSGPEKRFSQFIQYAQESFTTTHVEKHNERRGKADLEAFVDEFQTDAGGATAINDPCLPWTIAYQFSLGQWQDFGARLRARYTHSVESMAGQEKRWYLHFLKKWTLTFTESLHNLTSGLQMAQTILAEHHQHTHYPSPSPPPTSPGSSLAILLAQHQHLDRSLQHLLARIDEDMRKTDSDQQDEVAQTNILNSKESIAEAKSVRSLTVLAFVWIPFSAVSSVFGTSTLR